VLQGSTLQQTDYLSVLFVLPEIITISLAEVYASRVIQANISLEMDQLNALTAWQDFMQISVDVKAVHQLQMAHFRH